MHIDDIVAAPFLEADLAATVTRNESPVVTFLPLGCVGHPVSTEFGHAASAASIARVGVTVIADLAEIQDTIATDLALAVTVAPVALSDVGIITLLPSVHDTVAADLNETYVATLITRCAGTCITLLANVRINDTVAAVLGKAKFTAAVARLLVAIIAYFSLVNEAVATFPGQAELVALRISRWPGAGITVFPEFCIYSVIATVLGTALITAAVSRHGIAIITNLAYIDYVIATTFPSALRATLVSCDDVSVIAGLSFERLDDPIAA